MIIIAKIKVVRVRQPCLHATLCHCESPWNIYKIREKITNHVTSEDFVLYWKLILHQFNAELIE